MKTTDNLNTPDEKNNTERTKLNNDIEEKNGN